jgi:hypothetical protein
VDEQFHVNQCVFAGPRVLELGCGTGRHDCRAEVP